MPPKQRITREMILEKSFAMFCREGMEAVNARSVAKALNCSTQPIFSYFSGMDDLKNALDQKARDAFEQALMTEATGSEVLSSYCMTYVRFAKEQPRLFTHMFMRIEDAGMAAVNLLRDQLLQAEQAETGLDEEKARAVCVDTLVFAHGLATLMASARVNFTLEQAAEMIDRVHAGSVLGARQD